MPGPPRRFTAHPAVLVSALTAVVGLSALLLTQWPAAAPPVAGRVSAPSESQPAADSESTRQGRWQPSRHALKVVEDHWVRLPSGPADGRVFSIELWTGREYLIWGGEKPSEVTFHDSGAAYEPATGRWRRLADGPLGPRSEHVAVWSGEEVLVCCGRVESGLAGAAAYDPASDTWRRIADPPVDAVEFLTAVWTGRQMLVTGGVLQGGSRASHETVAYDPATDRWSVLAPAPTVIERQGQAVWTGDRMLVLTSGLSGGALLSYDPVTNTWLRLPAVPDRLKSELGSLVWTGSEAIVWGVDISDDGNAIGARFDPDDNRWRPMADDPLPRFNWFEGTPGSQAAVWTGREMLVWAGALSGGNAATTAVLGYEPSRDRWRSLPRAPLTAYQPEMMATGDMLLVGTAPLLAVDPG